ncbi:putative membrane protein [Wickerhamomyces ciferrii]|uniref:Quinate transporter n=1 Tax=Wickerhamomyces ciferrii (strain ATCC 14091 / BCRC 22168 / CBS 111 / JCM 3599 / NBRC 0793 / NRRL Y-1031 F-60-10) TaxID=1206466 RepID=K0KNY3_WICCF|nr:uncharacterized protein BN7_2352 [Wickerhamomyces ciferrii]CCH42808.1 putative membrane protein [Wickerhamomyces ciferrii]
MKFISNPLKITEDRSTPSEVYNWKVYIFGLILGLSSLEIGYDSGFIGGSVALDSFRRDFKLDEMSSSDSSFIISNIVSVFHAGCFFGSIFSYPLTFNYGRKIGLIGSSIIMAIGAIIMLISSKDRGLGPMYVGRTLTGLGVGASTSIVPVYLAECSPGPIRGRISSMYEIGWRIGDTVGFFISYGVDSTISSSTKQWFIPFSIQLIPAGLYLIGVFYLRESPRWLYSQDRQSEALKNLTWMRNLDSNHEYIKWEISNIKSELEYEKTHTGQGFFDPFLKILKSKILLRKLFISCSLYILQNLYGIQSINYFSPVFFKQIGVKGTNSSLFSTGMFGIVKLIATLFWSLFIVEQYGRRTTVLTCAPICAICFYYIGGYVKFNSGGASAKAALGMLYIWTFFFIVSLSGTPYIFSAEIISDTTIRGGFQVINSMFLWLSVFLMTRFTTNMIESMSYGIFFFFATWAVLTIPFVYFLMPETRGISLEYMDRLFQYKAWKAHKLVLNEIQEESKLDQFERLYEIEANEKNNSNYIETKSDETAKL